MAASFLNAKGRVFASALIYNMGAQKSVLATDNSTEPTPRNDDELLLEVDTTQLDLLLKHLKMYKLRSKVAIKHRPEFLSCMVPTETNVVPTYFETGLLTNDQQAHPPSFTCQDPRFPSNSILTKVLLSSNSSSDTIGIA